ncbi:MAG TPA: hypothetical protein VFR58_18205 [Flavisolibacter sp.]|nr:hypothetical protein [Flavisolibacter sp.]
MDSISHTSPRYKEYFLNNSEGDPVLYYVLSKGDTTDLQQFSYIYDSKGNWTRQLECERSLEALPAGRLNGYTLWVRTIHY